MIRSSSFWSSENLWVALWACERSPVIHPQNHWAFQFSLLVWFGKRDLAVNISLECPLFERNLFICLISLFVFAKGLFGPETRRNWRCKHWDYFSFHLWLCLCVSSSVIFCLPYWYQLLTSYYFPWVNELGTVSKGMACSALLLLVLERWKVPISCLPIFYENNLNCTCLNLAIEKPER